MRNREKRRPKACDYDNPNKPALRDAIENLMHYHSQHSGQRVTRFAANGSADRMQPAQVIVWMTHDPEVMHAIEDAITPHLGPEGERIPLPPKPARLLPS